MKISKLKYSSLFTLLLFILWEYVPAVLNVPVYIFPSISKIFTATFLTSNDWLNHMFVTAIEAMLGFGIGSAIGFFVGLLMAVSRRAAYVILPYVIASNAIPVIAIAPIIIMWFGNGLMSKVAVSAFLCFFPLSINTYNGLNNFPAPYQDFFLTYGASNFLFLRYFRLRNALPSILTGLRLNATFSVIGSVVGEIIASDSGLGYAMLQAIYSLNIPKLWGLVMISCLLGISAYASISLVHIYFKLKT